MKPSRLKLGAITVLTNESLALDFNGAAQENLDDRLSLAIQRGTDAQFLDPDSAGSAGVSPASILSGVAPLGSMVNSAASALAAIEALLAAHVNAGSDLDRVLIAVHPRVALAMSLMRTTNGDQVFPQLGATGGSISGVPVVSSVGCTRSGSPNERFIAAIDGGKVAVADDGQVEISASRIASIEMDSAPSGNAITPQGASQVSAFQTEVTAIKTVRFVNWQRATVSAVSWMTTF